MSLENHFRNLHDCSHWSKTFEKVLLAEAENSEEAATQVTQIVEKIQPELLDKLARRKQKAKIRQKLKKHIERTKERFFKNKS